jgi:molybdopterin converting factor subunit 1
MKIAVQLFARAKDLVNAASVELSLAEGATTRDLRRQLALHYPMLQGLLERSALAVDEEFAEETTVIRPGATVALLPPVSGG